MTQQNSDSEKPADPKRVMPGDFSISLEAKGGSDNLLREAGGERLHSMRGFEDTYSDIIDYIVRITHRIWEEKDIGYIYDTYAHNSKVYDDYGLQYGRDKIVADTAHTISAFPDIRLYADDIIWAGDDETGFHTSHRTVISGTNSGFSRYGAPTGRKVLLWCIANCVALENEIFKEWVIYDTAGLIHQLGFDLREMARKLGNELHDEAFPGARAGEPERLPGQGKPAYLTASGAGFDIEDFARRTMHNVWNRRCLKEVMRAYHPSLRVTASTGRSIHGRGDYQAFILSMIAMFPDLALTIDDLYWMGNDDDGYKVAIRWSVQGTHLGNGIYGQPTRRQVRFWGITQQQVEDGIIVAEWLLFNEFALMAQLYRD